MTLGCKNRKTGPMPTVWILREDISPVEAVATGQDVTNCGDCIHRGVWDPDLEKMVNRSCYVNYGQAPNSVWKAYKRGAYEEDLTVEQGKKYLSNKLIRWGGYGDPAIIDPMIFNSVNGAAAGHTGYTHQWRQPWAQWAREEFQASCDGLADYLDASSHGWKTFLSSLKDLTPTAANYARQQRQTHKLPVTLVLYVTATRLISTLSLTDQALSL